MNKHGITNKRWLRRQVLVAQERLDRERRQYKKGKDPATAEHIEYLEYLVRDREADLREA